MSAAKATPVARTTITVIAESIAIMRLMCPPHLPAIPAETPHAWKYGDLLTQRIPEGVILGVGWELLSVASAAKEKAGELVAPAWLLGVKG
jgi:hypothetical protein